MKIINMNNTNTAIEATSSENIYIATRMRTEVWEERREMDISTLECAGMAAVLEMFTYNNERSYVVNNLVTGEERAYDGDAIREWCATQTLDNMADYRITDTTVWDKISLLGKGIITHEVYFTCVKRSDVPEEIEHPLWLLEVTNADTNEVVARNWFETPGAMLTWADEQILDWRYTEAGSVNHRFYANGVEITKYFHAKDRKRYTLSVDGWDKKRIRVAIDTYQYSSLAKKGKKKFVCSICGEEHFVEEGTFLPHPVRPNKDSDGRYNYCCATCYEKYVGPMHACRWEIGTLWTKIKELEFWGHTWANEDMFYEMTIAEMDSIIKQGSLRKNAMCLLRYYEPNRDAEKVGRQLRDRMQKRRWQAARAAKLAEQETK
ncbi:MAG: hypothetical protein IJX67_01715 [Oscillospiraceae bacterium]|nr:hypothetical protein [Oscillospiraceae bacterium]